MRTSFLVSHLLALKASKLRFLDTMALHISVCGLASDQRTLYKAQKKSKMDTKAVADIMRFVGKPSVHGYGNEWKRETTVSVSVLNLDLIGFNFYFFKELEMGGSDVRKFTS